MLGDMDSFSTSFEAKSQEQLEWLKSQERDVQQQSMLNTATAAVTASDILSKESTEQAASQRTAHSNTVRSLAEEAGDVLKGAGEN
jgi:hypothetical protein